MHCLLSYGSYIGEVFIKKNSFWKGCCVFFSEIPVVCWVVLWYTLPLRFHPKIRSLSNFFVKTHQGNGPDLKEIFLKVKFEFLAMPFVEGLALRLLNPSTVANLQYDWLNQLLVFSFQPKEPQTFFQNSLFV